MSPRARPGDTIEQSYCRERTKEEHNGVNMRTVLRMLDRGSVREIRLNPDPQPFNID